MMRIAQQPKTKTYVYSNNQPLSGSLPSGKVSNEVLSQERYAVRDIVRYGKISTDY